jgi:hypothetical protein
MIAVRESMFFRKFLARARDLARSIPKCESTKANAPRAAPFTAFVVAVALWAT